MAMDRWFLIGKLKKQWIPDPPQLQDSIQILILKMERNQDKWVLILKKEGYLLFQVRPLQMERNQGKVQTKISYLIKRPSNT